MTQSRATGGPVSLRSTWRHFFL